MNRRKYSHRSYRKSSRRKYSRRRNPVQKKNRNCKYTQKKYKKETKIRKRFQKGGSSSILGKIVDGNPQKQFEPLMEVWIRWSDNPDIVNGA